MSVDDADGGDADRTSDGGGGVSGGGTERTSAADAVPSGGDRLGGVLKTIRKLVFGETWLLPLGVALIVAGAALVLRPLAGGVWHDAGALLMLAAVVVLVSAAVERGARG